MRLQTTTPEQDFRVGVLNSILTTPHRELDQITEVHWTCREQDPLFYGHLAAWYAQHGQVRDHLEMFAAGLITSDFGPEHRDAGLGLLADLPPYQVVRVVQACKRQWNRRPTCLRTEVERYLRYREADPDRFDSAVAANRQAMKSLYASLQIRPSPRAHQILFEDRPPEDSRLHAMRQIARSEDPQEQARLIVEHRIPFRTAVGLIRQITPAVLVALIEAMSPQEVINSMGLLKRHGAFNNPKVQALVEEKLERAQADRRVSGLKATVAREAAGVSGRMAKALNKVGDAQLRRAGEIRRPTALLIDASGSMEQAIQIGTELAAAIAGVARADLFVYAFDTVAHEVQSQGTELADWQQAMRGIRAGGFTSCGCALAFMERRNQYVEQIVFVTDEGENSQPHFQDAYRRYAAALNASPSVVFVKVGHSSDQLERDCEQMGVEYQAFEFGGDYYSIPNLLPMLSGKTRLDLVFEILDTPLPKRKDWSTA